MCRVIFLNLCVCPSLSTAEQTWTLAQRSSERICRSSLKVKVRGQRSRSPGKEKNFPSGYFNVCLLQHWDVSIYLARKWFRNMTQRREREWIFMETEQNTWHDPPSSYPPLLFVCFVHCRSSPLAWHLLKKCGLLIPQGTWKSWSCIIALQHHSISCYTYL